MPNQRSRSGRNGRGNNKTARVMSLLTNPASIEEEKGTVQPEPEEPRDEDKIAEAKIHDALEQALLQEEEKKEVEKAVVKQPEISPPPWKPQELQEEAPPPVAIPTVETPTPPPVATPTVETPTPPPVATPTVETPTPPPVATPTVETPAPPPVATPTVETPAPPPVATPTVETPAPPPTATATETKRTPPTIRIEPEVVEPSQSVIVSYGNESSSEFTTTTQETDMTAQPDNNDAQFVPAHPATVTIQKNPAPAGNHTTKEVPTDEQDDDFICFNLTQALVETKADKYMKLLDMCTCNRCKVDVTAIALSNLPAKYVATRNTEILPLLSVYEGKYSAAVTAQVMSACKIVLDRPHHKRG